MMLKLEYSLVKPDDPILRRKTRLISKPDFETILAYQAMVELLKRKRYKWLALAAPQVGSGQSFFVSDFLLQRPNEYECFINPEISTHAEYNDFAKEEAEENCVSLPGVTVKVPRWKKIGLKYKNLFGEERTIILQGMQARVAQHEVDHLNGVLITDYLKGGKDERSTTT